MPWMRAAFYKLKVWSRARKYHFTAIVSLLGALPSTTSADNDCGGLLVPSTYIAHEEAMLCAALNNPTRHLVSSSAERLHRNDVQGS